MNFYKLYHLLENVNTRSINPSGGAGLKVQSPASPQKGEVKPGGSFSPGTKSLKDVPPSQFNAMSKDEPKDIKKFNGRPISPFQSLFPQIKPFTPPPGPMLPRFGTPNTKLNKATTRMPDVHSLQ